MPAKTSSAIPLQQIAKAVRAEVLGDASRVTVSGASSLEEAGPSDLAYVAADQFVKSARRSKAAALVVGRPTPELNHPQLVVPNPAYAFARIVQRFFTSPYRARGKAAWVVQGEDVQIGPDVSIWPFVTLGDRVKIGARVTLYPGVFIGDDCEIGDDAVLYPNVAVRERCTIGRRVIIHSGSVVGSDGFGYVQHEDRHHKIPQIGTVIIEDDVELGANVTVDRATFGRTVIKRGTKVDNLVQIAHNVTVGEDCILVSQVGIAGSTTLGHYVMVGGQTGISDHLRIGDRVMIAARSGVDRDVEAGQIVSGAPAMPHELSLKTYAGFLRLPAMREHLRDLERRIRALESPLDASASGKGKPRGGRKRPFPRPDGQDRKSHTGRTGRSRKGPAGS